MGTRINVSLSQNSFKEAAKKVREYRDRLQRKNEMFINKLADIGLKTVQQTMESVPSDEKGSYYTEVIMDSKSENIIGAAIRLTGDKVLFIEFSAGVTYGTPQGGYPLPSGKAYGVGTYPEQTHAYDPNGWWYKGEDGKKHHSYGNRAYMPMYKAEQSLILTIQSIAKEVFSS